MRQRELTRLIGKLGKLTRLERQQVMAALAPTDSRVGEMIEERGTALGACPHRKGTHVVKNGRADGLQRYRCRTCRRSFNALTGTPLARLRMKGKWLDQAAALRDGLTIHEAAERLGVNPKTAFLWRHRFLAAPKTVMAQALVETYFLRTREPARLLAMAVTV